jgi:hypothetical protein
MRAACVAVSVFLPALASLLSDYSPFQNGEKYEQETNLDDVVCCSFDNKRSGF